MRFFSLEGKLTLALFVAIGVAAALALVIDSLIGRPWLSFAVTLVVGTLLAPLYARGLTSTVASLFRTLAGSVTSFKDGDFNFSIAAERRDELGDLVRAHNDLGRVLREERQGLFQRELLLDTVVQNTPTAIVLTEPHGHVVYANVAARQLLNSGRRLQGLDFAKVVSECPAAFGQAVRDGGDTLFTVPIDGEEETFHFSQRSFNLQGRQHCMYLIKRMTREISRQEVATWKKVIRVISHELNNSLAPMSSLAHSGRLLAQKGDLARLAPVFDTIEDRTRHLHLFIRGYAEFAKLPQPRAARVPWAPLLEAIASQFPGVAIGDPPAIAAWFDRAQVEQVLINLIKNAHESGSAVEDIRLDVSQSETETRIDVRDRGTGMSEAVLASALLPFYSTKRSGTGLGLALAREIAEAHGGRIILANRDHGGLKVTLVLPRPLGADATVTPATPGA
ncbi:sensor histidine kinase [Tahibacter amnicola]|uniref:histidine kinase n=1 Tax=Tahibacter amnicola TaxID=2976241 RepID=A0ABY6BH74_9GAMM|nr:ATP-binding protein [Tahibacter amnicola]UXI69368.1 ATP-binding protein [Tahibacter amnicola]